jgi:hypothetical protein
MKYKRKTEMTKKTEQNKKERMKDEERARLNEDPQGKTRRSSLNEAGM